jgi:cytochrome b561
VNAMMILVLVHSAAALFHQYVLKDGLLRRMMKAS